MKRFLLILALWLSIAAGATAQTATPPAGSGTEADPYQIASLENLVWLSQTPDKWGTPATRYYFIQTKDIPAESTVNFIGGEGFSPIGSAAAKFYGSYDGQGYAIKDLTINRGLAVNVGLFGYAANATIKNVGLSYADITGGTNVGSLIGHADAVAVTRCFSRNSVVSGQQPTGGLIGESNNTQVTSCYSITGAVSGYQMVGGLIGEMTGSSKMLECYSTNKVTNGTDCGGLLGMLTGGSVASSYYNSETSNQNDNSGKGEPRTTAQLKAQSTYAGWNFLGETTSTDAYVWAFSSDRNDGYPITVPNQSDKITLTSANSGGSTTPLEFNTANDVYIDWGDGVLHLNKPNKPVLYVLTNLSITPSYTAGSTVKIYGNGIVNFQCPKQSLTSLDVSKCGQLQILYCQSNGLTAIDISKNPVLSILNCSNNQLKGLNTSANPALSNLDCSKNQLEVLTSANPLLISIITNNNKLLAADFSKNPELLTLYCNNNSLTTLDVSANAKLTQLYCNNNSLTTLDVSANAKLTLLYCNNNSLTSIKAAPSEVLGNLNCSNNSLTFATMLPYKGALQSKYSSYTYAPQQNLKVAVNNGVVDLSSQLKAVDKSNNLRITSYTWYTATTPNVALKAGTDYTEKDGVFTFLTTPASPVYCVMINDAYFNFSGTNIFRTENITVEKQIPLAFSFTVGSVDPKVIFYMKCSSEGSCLIDWGNGVLVKNVQRMMNPQNYYSTCTPGSTVKVYANGVTYFTTGQGHDITSFDMSGSPDLEYFDISNGKEAVTLNLSSNSKLKTFNCPNNQISNLDVSGFPELVKLNCSKNLLKSLDLSKNEKLKSLDCYRNQLSTLNLSKQMELEQLFCTNNQLAELMLPSTTTLTSINITNNKLDLNTLPKVKSSYTNNYGYAPQYPFTPKVTSSVVDLSSQLKATDANGKEYTTTYTWYSSANTEIPKGHYTENNGVFTFLLPHTDGAFCVMTNDAFPAFVKSSAGYILSTEKVNLKATPIIEWINPLDIIFGEKLKQALANADGTFTYTPSLETLLNVGDGQTIKIDFTPNSTGSFEAATKTVTVNVKKKEVVATASTHTITKGEAITTPTISYTGFVNNEDASVLDTKPTLTNVPTAESNAGEYVIGLTGGSDNNYKFFYVDGKITINKITPTISWNGPNGILYGTPISKVQLNATANTEGTFEYDTPIGEIFNKGPHYLSVTFTPNDMVNYNVATSTTSISVEKAPLTVTASSYTIVKGEAIPTLGINYDGFVNGENETVLDTKPTVTTTATAASNPGVYDIIVTGGGDNNYNFTYNTGTLTISKITSTISWTTPATITYGTPVGNAQLSATVSNNGSAVAGTLSYTVDGNALKTGDILTAGAHSLKVTFTPTDAVNYSSVEATATLTVQKRIPTIRWDAPPTITYGMPVGNPQLAATASYSGVAVAGTFSYTADGNALKAGDILAAGAHNLKVTFTPTDAVNCSSVETTATLTVEMATPAIIWEAPSAITYGTPVGDAQFNATASYSGAAVAGTFSYTADGNALKAGDILPAGDHTLKATFTPTDAANFSSVEATVSLTVKKAPLTVTASSHTIVKGEAIPALGVSYDGFVNGEDESVLDTKPTATTTTATSNTGVYDITAAGGADGNYDFAYKSGTLTILDKYIPVVAWAEPNGITYGAALSNAQLNATASYSEAAVAGTFTYAPALGATLAAGKHDLKVTFTPTDGDHYISVEKAVTITVAKVPLTATASSYSIREGEAIPALGVTYSGFVNGDTEAMLNTKPTATTNATATSPTGVYGITVDGGADDNYDIAYVAGKLTVSNPIVVDALQAPQPACEGDKLSLAYTLTSGRPTEYQIVFDAKALAAGFDNSGYAALADNGTVSFSIPARVADGTYQASLQLRNGYGNISELAAFQVTVNVSADVIVPKFGNVVLIDNHDGRFTGYQWYRNGSAIGGATNQFYKDPNGLSGTYYAQLKTATGQTLNTCSKALSLKKSAQASVSVYPNPARAGQELTVKLSGFADEELQGAVLSVYSSQGVPVLTSSKVEQENRITLTGTDGVYMGRITTADGQVLTFKVVLAN